MNSRPGALFPYPSGGYRPDIDGLRAVAVAAVVIFHAFPTRLTGGFIGVDVFFVISGFLITRIVRDGVAAGTFSFSAFYERRIRRILPALAVVTAATALVGLILLPPGDLKALGRSIGPSMLFAANIHFAHKISYFAPADDVRPLLHLWSLAVEEQVYIVWPLVIWLAARAPKVVFNSLLAAVLLLSLGADQIAAHRDPLAAFFDTPLRAWEPLVGAAVAVYWTRPIRAAWLREALAAAGLAAILASAVLLSAAVPVPGLAAVPACLGTGLLLQTGRFGARTLVARGLSWAPMVYLGAISYALYLWHWPILTFLRLGGPTDPPAVVMAGGVAFSLALAALSLRFVEGPTRRPHKGGLSRPALFAAAVATVAVLAGVGALLAADEGLRHRVGGPIAAADAAEHDFPATGDCAATRLGAPTRCAFGLVRPGPPDLVLLGDSEAEAWEAGVADFALAHGLKGQLVDLPACPPVLGVDERDAYGRPLPCAAHTAAVLDQIAADPRIRVLVLAARWALYDQGPDDDHPNAYLVAPDGRRDPARFHALLAAGLARALARVEAARGGDLTLLILRPTPEFPVNPPRCAARAMMAGQNPAPCLQTPAAPIRARQAPAEATLTAAAAAHPNLRLLTANPQLCAGDVCRAELEGRWMFRDGNHLTATGARLLGPGVFAGVQAGSGR